MSSKKFSLILIITIILTLGLSISLGSLLAAWTTPASAPPEGNIAAPLNTSATGQAKQGGLILNTGGSVNGLIVQFGNVGIGTTSPGAKLAVDGNIIAAAPTANNHLTTKEYVDAAAGSCISTCGNGILEAGEGCDDGNTSWTSGACGGDCSRRNYWSDPSVGQGRLFSSAINRFCQERGFNSSVLMSSTLYTSGTNSYTTYISGYECYLPDRVMRFSTFSYTISSVYKYFEGYSAAAGIWTTSSIIYDVSATTSGGLVSSSTNYYYCGVTSSDRRTYYITSSYYKTSGIWCAD